MSNRICQVEVRERLGDPAQSELWVCVHPERTTPATEVSGRFAGPRCRYATTVEVAYPLRHFARLPEGLPGIARRVVIPEPSFWDPESPFLYHGTIELWEDGSLVDRVQLRRGLRSIQLGSGGLRVNGRAVMLQGRKTGELKESKTAELRAAGVNLLAVPAGPECQEAWDTADELGFFVLGQLAREPASWALARSLQDHPSALGWIIEQEILESQESRDALAAFCRESPQIRIGVLLEKVVPSASLMGIRFIACPASLLGDLSTLALPKLVWDTFSTRLVKGQVPNVPREAAVLGWVQE